MKKLYFLFVMLLIGLNSAYSQQQLFANQPPDSVVRQNPRTSAMEFVPGEVLIKFRDEVAVNLSYKGSQAQTGINAIDNIFANFNVTTAEKLFPGEQRLKSKVILKAFNGKEFEKPSLHNIYKLKFARQEDLFTLMDTLKKDTAHVVYAEPNYLLSITDDKPLSPILSEKEMQDYLISNPLSSPPSGETKEGVNDPLYPQQWYIPAVHADAVWDSVQGKDTTQVIAILDTGVDWLHPDLMNKIWINPGEIPGNGIDDDGNGFVDDVRGWDWINNDNNPMDDNSHGTHVAGIAAAEANNGIGISGVSHGAKIMPLKVFQSSGQGDAATISQGIIYATQKGATVINMSFGSYTNSLTMEEALANAYATTILVAAAGNDNKYIGPERDCQYQPGVAFYPAALSFVLGTQVPSGCGLGFSNYDNSPTYSGYPDLLNYEMNAPGTNIISTIPNGNYRVYQGTSMAAPVVSGAVSLYKSQHPTDSQELMWGNLINTSGEEYINIDYAIKVIPVPKLMFVNKTMLDTLAGDDNDGIVDAGETIQLWFNIRNTWGQCDSVMVGLQFGEFEDTTTAQIIIPKALIGSTSPYATRSNQYNPLKIHINPNVAHDRDIRFTAFLWYPNSPDTIRQNIVINVANGEELSGVMDTTLILTPDKLWLVNNSFRVGSNGHLIIKPGVHMILQQNIIVKGIVTGIGKSDSLIFITGPGSFMDPFNAGIMDVHGRIKFSFTNFNGITNSFEADSLLFHNCIFTEITELSGFGWIFHACAYFSFENNCIRNSIWGMLFAVYVYNNYTFCNFNSNNFNNCIITGGACRLSQIPTNQYNNFVKIRDYRYSMGWGEGNSKMFQIDQSLLYNNYISFDIGTYIYTTYDQNDVENIPNQYWGTTNLNKIRGKNWDFWKDPNLPMFTYDPILTAPSDSAHAVTWKILVNGKDAQDEYVDPVGIGPQHFDVYFNREMDTTYTPQLSFGVRYPYTQQPVTDSGRWDATHRIWTAYKTIKLYTGDGINRLRVAGARGFEDWEIPVEDMRFEFLINAAGSSSMDFTATPGLGKVKLEWNNADIEDLLGFNMYRFQNITDTTFTSPILINTELITDTLFTDFNVTPGTHYYYYYKVVRTDFAESDSSHIVNAIPVTASAGDANGDLAVNVLDITTIISYLLNQNPQPFIFEAADVNGDNSVNVLDVIGVVNLITGNKKSISNVVGANAVPAYIYLKPDRIKFRSNAQVAGLQFTLKGSNLKEVKLSSLVDGFEFAYTASDTAITGILFSFSGKTIPAGLQDILHIEAGDAVLNWEDVTGGDKKGQYVTVIKAGEVLPVPSDYSLKAYPNPTSGEMTLSFDLPENAKVNISIYNLYGQLVTRLQDATLNYGNHQLHWQAPKAGVYICRMQATATDAKKARYYRDIKLIVIK